MRTSLFAVIVSLCVSVGCRVDSARTPSPTGPSEFALAIALTATPDVIRQDGASVSVIQIAARDADARPRSGVSVRLETLANGVVVDFGVLSSRTVTTGADGLATVTYVAPAAPPASAQSDVVVTIRAVPIGTNYANALSRTVEIRLTRPGVILPPNGTPIPSFFASPASTAENEVVTFDASASRDDGTIVSYAWTFGDGETAIGKQVTHAYELAGTYLVTLTVTDDRGLSASTLPTDHTVVAAANPVAAFTISPTDPQVGAGVVFNAATSTAPTGRRIVAWNWDFGDGHQATGVAPTHVFTVPQTYTVVLTVTDNTGRKGVIAQTITINPSPRPGGAGGGGAGEMP